MDPAASAAPPVPGPLEAPGAGLIDAWLSGRAARTLEAYRADLEDFRVLTFYDDSRADLAGEVARKVAGSL